MYSSPADSQHRLSGPDSKGMEIHCKCLCCSHTVHMGHECFLSTTAEDMKKSMTHSSVVSDGSTNNGIAYIMVVNKPRLCHPAQYGRSHWRRLSIS